MNVYDTELEEHPIVTQQHQNYSTNGELGYQGYTPAAVYQGNNELDRDDDPYQLYPQDALLRNRMPTAREAASGIEEIIMEMPSRTIGRGMGGHIGTMVNATLARRSASRYRKRQLVTLGTFDGIERPNDEIQELYEELADEQTGEIDNEELRQFPVSMAVKKQVRSHANENREKKKSRTVGSFKIWRYNMSIKWRHFKQDTKKFAQNFRLWQQDLKQVEGHFGTGVSSYFTFLRGLFLLSIPSFIFNFAFISLPQLLQQPNRTDPNITFTGEELLTGANWLTETIMYYGYYINGTIEAIPGSEYDMPLAYLLATAGYFVLCLILIVRTTASSFRQNYVDGRSDYNNFISKVFCAWDFGITSETAAKLQHKTITTELKEILSEQRRSGESRDFQEKLKLFSLRLLTWTLYLSLTGGCMALVYFVNDFLLDDIKKGLGGIVILEQIALALIVSSINLIMPIIINLLTHLEKYKYPRHEIYIAVFRNYILKMGLIAVICAFWTDDELKSTSNDNNGSATVECWETELGQEIYRLVIIDFLFTIFFATFCAEFLRKLLVLLLDGKEMCRKLDRAEFAIVNSVMDLIYGQTLCWIGVFFCPLLAGIVFIKYFFMFYIKKVSVMQNCRPSRKRWRGGQSQTIFIGMLLLSFLLSAIFLCVVVFREVPSTACGPYRDQDRSYDVVVNLFNSLYATSSGQWFATIMDIIFSVWFLYSVAAGLLVWAVIKSSEAKGYEELVRSLRAQIELQGDDKQLLLKWLQSTVANQNGKPPPTGGAFQGGKENHVVPILHHRDSAKSTPCPSRSASARNSPKHDINAPMTGDVLTYVDPQHVQASHLVGERMMATTSFSNPSQISLRQREHKDPLLHKALANQQRPRSMFVEGVPSSYDTQRRNSFAGASVDLEDLDTETVYEEILSDPNGPSPLLLALSAKVQAEKSQSSERRPGYGRGGY
ncbi:unnamed protein product [Clavelina lepadiformis]|uniref:TMC domain-containing protein n=1 Tax=Clavelina lepadiformis TaxID=159417 RepID=A0ABP0EV44_CLALP